MEPIREETQDSALEDLCTPNEYAHRSRINDARTAAPLEDMRNPAWGPNPEPEKPGARILLVDSIVEFEPKVPMETFLSFADPLDTTLLDQLFVVAIYMWYSFGQQMAGRSPKRSAKSKNRGKYCGI